MTSLIARDRIDGSKADTANGVNVANFTAGTGNVWDCIQTLGIGISVVATGTATLTQANAGLLLVDASAGNVIINLPACSAAVGALFQFKRLDTSANTVTINRAGGDNIDGQNSYTLGEAFDFVEMRSDGTSAWRALNNAIVAGKELLTTGSGTAYVITPTPALNAYKAGRAYWVNFHTASGSNPTLQISGLATPPNLVAQQADGSYANVASIPAGHRSMVVLLSATQALVVLMPPATTSPQHGQCVLDLPNANLRLRLFNGNRLQVNGVSCTIPDAGVTLTPTGLQPVFSITNRSITGNVATLTHAALPAALPVGARLGVQAVGGAVAYNGNQIVTASTTTTTSYACVAANEASTADTGRIVPVYYIYATQAAGVVSALQASFTGHSTSTTANNKGVEIMTGDDTRTLVGMVTVGAGPVFGLVASWFNRRSLTVNSPFTTNQNGSSSTYLPLGPQVGFLAFSGDAARIDFSGQITGNGTSSYIAASIGIDNPIAEEVYSLLANQPANSGSLPSISYGKSGLSEGVHYAVLLCNNVGAGNAYTAVGSATPGARCAISATYQG